MKHIFLALIALPVLVLGFSSESYAKKYTNAVSCKLPQRFYGVEVINSKTVVCGTSRRSRNIGKRRLFLRYWRGWRSFLARKYYSGSRAAAEARDIYRAQVKKFGGPKCRKVFDRNCQNGTKKLLKSDRLANCGWQQSKSRRSTYTEQEEYESFYDSAKKNKKSVWWCRHF